MTRRRSICLGALLLAGLAVALLVPEIRYSIPGWLRGDHCYRGLPTSYWSGAIQDWHKATSTPRSPPITLLSRWFAMSDASPPAPGLLGRGREGMPVLIELLRDRDPFVKIQALSTLASLGPAAREAVPALRQALADDEEPSDPLQGTFRVYAALALWQIDRQAEPVVSPLMAAVKKGRSPDLTLALWGLAQMGPDARTAVPVLVDVFKKGKPFDSTLALDALRGIGPEAKAAVPAILEAWRMSRTGTPGIASPDDLRRTLEEIDPETAARAVAPPGSAAKKAARPAAIPP